MTTRTKLVVGGNGQDDAKAFLAAWHRSEAGEAVSEKTLSFGSWEALSTLMMPARYRLLKRLGTRPATTVQDLADDLARPYRRVHDDVVALASAGLIERSRTSIRLLADVVQAQVRFF